MHVDIDIWQEGLAILATGSPTILATVSLTGGVRPLAPEAKLLPQVQPEGCRRMPHAQPSAWNSSRNAAPGRTIAATDDVISPFVKNAGSASEYVKAELDGRRLMGLLCMSAAYQFGPLHYRDKEVAART